MDPLGISTGQGLGKAQVIRTDRNPIGNMLEGITQQRAADKDRAAKEREAAFEGMEGKEFWEADHDFFGDLAKGITEWAVQAQVDGIGDPYDPINGGEAYRGFRGHMEKRNTIANLSTQQKGYYDKALHQINTNDNVDGTQSLLELEKYRKMSPIERAKYGAPKLVFKEPVVEEEEFDLNKALSEIGKVGMTSYSNEDEDGVKTTSGKYVDANKVREEVKFWSELPKGEKVIEIMKKRNPGSSDEEILEKVFKQQMRRYGVESSVAYNPDRSKDVNFRGSGYSKEDYLENRQQWLNDFKINYENEGEAAGYIKGIEVPGHKGKFLGAAITNFDAQDMVKTGHFPFSDKTNAKLKEKSLDEILELFNGKRYLIEVSDSSGDTELITMGRDESDEALLKMYDEAILSRKHAYKDAGDGGSDELDLTDGEFELDLTD